MAQQRTIGSHKTTVFTEDGLTKVVYHSTPVIKWNDAKIILNSGGYRSNTTKTRINQASNQFDLGVKVYQQDYIWFVDYNGQTLDFTDNMTIERVKQ